MPLHRRLPKRGFNNKRFADKVLIVTLYQLEKKFDDGATVNEQSLRESGLVTGECDQIKILGNGELSKKLTVDVDALSASAKEKIEKAGGSIA